MFNKNRFILGLLLLHLLVGVAQVAGQQPNKQLVIGKLEAGTLSHDSPEIAYAFTARADLNIEIEIVVAVGDLIPSISLKQGDAVLQSWDGTEGETTLKAQYSFKESGQYIIAISNLNHTTGTFALTVRETQAVVLPSLILGTPVYDSVARGETVRYQIQADPNNNTTISVAIDNLTQSVSAKLITSDDITIGIIGSGLNGGGFRIPLGNDQYVLEVTNGDNGSVPIDFEVLLTNQTD